MKPVKEKSFSVFFARSPRRKCPRVALPSRPRHYQRCRTAWTCEGASYAALLKFLPSGLSQRSRSATSKTVVAPMARAGLSPRVALPFGPWAVLWRRTAWACGGMPNAPRVLSRPSLLPAGPRSTACNTRGPSCTERGAGPSALGLRCHRAHGMINGAVLLGHAKGHLTQPCCSFYPPFCSESCDLLPRRPSWRRWPGQPSARGLRCHPAHGLFYGTVLRRRVEGGQTHPVCCHDPICYPKALAALPAPPNTLVHPAVA